MGISKKGKAFIIFSVLLPFVLIALLLVNWFVYPFASANPNFADVEAVYNKMVVPADWVKKGEGANKGIAGRQCPIESDGCFHKSADYSIGPSVQKEDVANVAILAGCTSPFYKDETYKGELEGSRYNYSCFVGGIRIGLSVNMNSGEVHVVAASR